MRLVAALVLVAGCSSSAVPGAASAGASGAGGAASSGVTGTSGPSSAAGTGGQGGAPACPGTTGSIESFAACFRYDDWTLDGVPALESAPVGTDQTCTSCHAKGANGVFLDAADDMATFSANTTFPFVTRWMTVHLDADGCVSDISRASYFEDAGVAPCDDHPCFDLPSGVVMSLQQFFADTHARWAQGMCDQP